MPIVTLPLCNTSMSSVTQQPLKKMHPVRLQRPPVRDLNVILEAHCDEHPPDHERVVGQERTRNQGVAATIAMSANLASPKVKGSPARYAFRTSDDHREVMRHRQVEIFHEKSEYNENRERDKHFGIERIRREGERPKNILSPPPGGRLEDVRIEDYSGTEHIRTFVKGAINDIFPPKVLQPSQQKTLKPAEPLSPYKTLSSVKTGSVASKAPDLIDSRDRIVRWRVATPHLREEKAKPLYTPQLRLQPLSPFLEPTETNPGPEAVHRPPELDDLLDKIDRNMLFEEEIKKKKEVMPTAERQQCANVAFEARVGHNTKRLNEKLKVHADISKGILSGPQLKSRRLHERSIKNQLKQNRLLNRQHGMIDAVSDDDTEPSPKHATAHNSSVTFGEYIRSNNASMHLINGLGNAVRSQSVEPASTVYSPGKSGSTIGGRRKSTLRSMGRRRSKSSLGM